jgi:3-oxoacyl-[acyl-carrier protein] reductase
MCRLKPYVEAVGVPSGRAFSVVAKLVREVVSKDYILSSLKDRVAIVTGGSKGIGAGIAKALAAKGARVVVSYVSDKAGADGVVKAIKDAGGQAFAVKADASIKTEADSLVQSAVERFGQLDILVNNGGIYQYGVPIEESTEELYHRQFDINVLGTFLVTQSALNHLGKGASIVNISSGATKMTPAYSAIYSATKGAIDAMTRVLSRELGPRGIRVNAVNPGLVETEGTQAGGYLEGATRAWAEGAAALGRLGRVDDIAPVVVFLASDDARWLTGEIIYATGGM